MMFYNNAFKKCTEKKSLTDQPSVAQEIRNLFLSSFTIF